MKVIANVPLFAPPLGDIHTNIAYQYAATMKLSSPAGRTAVPRPSYALLLFLAILLLARISAAQDTTDANDAATTDVTTTGATATTATASGTTETGTSATDSSSTSSSTESSSTTSSSSTSSGYPVVTVPPTAGAPYMQTSSTPEGTVFIAVGAVLGFLGLAVLAWRGLVAWSVNRSVRQQAATMQSTSEKRGLLRSRRRRSSARSKSRSRSRSRSNIYNGGHAPTGNIGGGYRPHSHYRRRSSSRGDPKLKEVKSSSNNMLFFSPTAGASMHSSGKRSSQHQYQPGYGASTPRNPGSSQQWQPPYRGRPYPPPPRPQRTIVSPPVSPNLRPTGSYMGHSRPLSADTTSSSSLNPASQGRAPSEYLEDLFESHARPGSGSRDWDRR